MQISCVRGIEVARTTHDGDVVIRTALVRDPERDGGKYITDSNGRYVFAKKSQLRSRMLERYLQEDIVIYIPKRLAEEVREEFYEYAESYPWRRERGVTSVICDVTGTHYDLATQQGRRLDLLIVLAAYRFLRNAEKDYQRLMGKRA